MYVFILIWLSYLNYSFNVYHISTFSVSGNFSRCEVEKGYYARCFEPTSRENSTEFNNIVSKVADSFLTFRIELIQG